MNAPGGNHPGMRRCYHRIIKDTVKTIQPSVFKGQLEDTSDIVGKPKLAPRTRAGMERHFYDNLDNYFMHPGRRVQGRPLQKIVERTFDTLKKEMKQRCEGGGGGGVLDPSSSNNNVKLNKLEPLTNDLRTSKTKQLPGLVMEEAVPPLPQIFPSRNLNESRKSYSRKKTDKAHHHHHIPLSSSNIITLSGTNVDHLTLANGGGGGGIQFITIPSTSPTTPTKFVTYNSRGNSGGNKSPSPTRPVYITCDNQGSRGGGDRENGGTVAVGGALRAMSPLKQFVTISNNGEEIPMEIAVAHIPQYSTEVCIDASTSPIKGENHHHHVSPNVFDLSDLIQTNENQEESSSPDNVNNEIVLCNSVEDINQVIVMGQNGERYRFVELNDGQFTLVPESAVSVIQ